jgi:hypothetical protein
MADTDRELDWAAKNVVQGAAVAPQATPVNYADTSHLRTRLAAINGSYFTAARLNQMTKNDMMYAVRIADDPGSI